MKTVVITGATSGIGLAVLKALAAQNYKILAVGHTKDHCDMAEKALKSAYPDCDAAFFSGDLMQQNEANDIADSLIRYLDESCSGRLDILINNAGGIRNYYATTKEGYEQQFALNHLAGFLLTFRLMPHLMRGEGKILFTGSESHKRTVIRWNDIMFSRGRYSCLYAYKQSKLCNMLFALELNRRFNQSGIRAYVVDPGLVNTDIGNKQTSGLVDRFWALRKRFGDSPEYVAQTYVFLCGNNPDGMYYRQTQLRKMSTRAADPADARRLFELSERLCNIRFQGGAAS